MLSSAARDVQDVSMFGATQRTEIIWQKTGNNGPMVCSPGYRNDSRYEKPCKSTNTVYNLSLNKLLATAAKCHTQALRIYDHTM